MAIPSPAVPTVTSLPLEDLPPTCQRSRDLKPTATYPFDNAHRDADIIFFAADGTTFYLHCPILRLTSLSFFDMSRLPEPVTGLGTAKSNLPTMPIPESAETFDRRLLRTCYPVNLEKPLLFDVPLIRPTMLEAAMKYQMPAERKPALMECLLSLCSPNPYPCLQ